MNDNVLIRVEDLHKSFGSLQVLRGVTEQISKGEVVSVIGPSGGGKSTFLRCLNLLEVPTSGHIYFEGVDITDKSVDINVHRQKMGMVFQHFNVFNNLTVSKNVTLAPVLLGKKKQKEADEMAKDLLSRVGLLEKWDQYPKKLSGGQKQRLAIVRALAMEPDVIYGRRYYRGKGIAGRGVQPSPEPAYTGIFKQGIILGYQGQKAVNPFGPSIISGNRRKAA